MCTETRTLSSASFFRFGLRTRRAIPLLSSISFIPSVISSALLSVVTTLAEAHHVGEQMMDARGQTERLPTSEVQHHEAGKAARHRGSANHLDHRLAAFHRPALHGAVHHAATQDGGKQL